MIPKNVNPIDFIYNNIDIDKYAEENEKYLSHLNFTPPSTARISFLEIYGQVDFKKLFPTLFPDLIKYISLSFEPNRALTNLNRFSKEIYDKNYLYTILNNNRWLTKAIICLFSGSQYLSDIIFKDPGLFDYLRTPETLNKSRTKDQMFRDLTLALENAEKIESLHKALRKFKKKEFIRIVIRDLLNFADLTETMKDISNVADVCLQRAYRFCEKNLIKKFGTPTYIDEKGAEHMCGFTVIGMGKLGGRDLNFSSDIDLMYLYSSDKGKTKGEGIRISNHEFYVKLSTMITKAIGEITEDGNVFRVDLGLRPEGLSGDIASSLTSYEIYYQSWGQTWERQALIKARISAGSADLGNQFMKMRRPFIYRKYLDMSALDEIKIMKDKINKSIINKKVKTDDIKLGKGGIREIEFIIQVFQLLYGGRDEAIRKKNTLQALKLVHKGGYINKEDFEILFKAYYFLRNLEHRIQISFGLQTHKIPENPVEREILARKMGISKETGNNLYEELIIQYSGHTEKVHKIYSSILSKKELPEEGIIKGLHKAEDIFFDNNDRLFVSEEITGKYKFFFDSKSILNLFLIYKGSSFSPTTQKSKEIFQTLTPKILQYCSLTPDPVHGMHNLEKFISASGSMDYLFNLFLKKEKILKRLLALFGSSDFLSNILITQPDLIVALFDLDGINRPKSKKKMIKGLNNMLNSLKGKKKIPETIAIFKKGEVLRIGLKHIIGDVKLIATFEDLSNLAEVCLYTALEFSKKKMKTKYGTPCYFKNGRKLESKLCILGMGKLGGYELDFGSDLDIIFIYSEDGKTSGSKSRENTIIDNHLFFTKVCESVLNIITEGGDWGPVYKIDSQLRPEGNKGLLTTSIKSLENYLGERAQTWEMQAMTKARLVAGDLKTGGLFINRIHNILYNETLKNSTIFEIRTMRTRLEKERGKEKKGKQDVKFGYGALLDIEFIVQLIQMKYGIADPSLRTANTLTALKEINKRSILSPEDYQQLKNSYIFYRKILMNLRIENQLSRNTLPSSLDKLLKRLKYTDNKKNKAEKCFIDDYKEHTNKVRNIYNKIFFFK